MACDQCRRAKLKCDNHQQPCHVCRRKQIACTRLVPCRRSGRPRHRQLDRTTSPSEAQSGFRLTRYRDITPSTTWRTNPNVVDTLTVSPAPNLTLPGSSLPATDWEDMARLSSELAGSTGLEKEVHAFMQHIEPVPDAINDKIPSKENTFPEADEPLDLGDVDFDLIDQLWHLPMVRSSKMSLATEYFGLIAVVGRI